MGLLTNYFVLLGVASAMLFVGVFLMLRYGYGPSLGWLKQQEARYDRVFRHQLMMDVSPATVVGMHVGGVLLTLIIGAYLTGVMVGIVLAGVATLVPYFVIRHLETKRRKELETQLVDGLSSLASGVRAGLNLVQSMQLLVQNQRGPIQQEFGQILREYEMGMDLNQAMHAASNRIASPLYRLTFTAIEMHRVRGGDSGESMDRIADSIREIQGLENKLDAITAQGRAQANFMAAMPLVIIAILFVIMPDMTEMLFTRTEGRLILLVAGALILTGYLWIKKIMKIDI